MAAPSSPPGSPAESHSPPELNQIILSAGLKESLPTLDQGVEVLAIQLARVVPE